MSERTAVSGSPDDSMPSIRGTGSKMMRRREQARAHQPFGMGGPKAGVQPGQRVQGVEQLLGQGWVRQGTGRHAFLLGTRVVTSAAFPRLIMRGRTEPSGGRYNFCEAAREHRRQGLGSDRWQLRSQIV